MSCAGMAMLRLGFASGGGSGWGEEESRRGATDNDDVGRRGTEMREVQTARQARERAGECLCAQTSDGWPGEGAGRGSMRPRQRQKAHQLSDNEKSARPCSVAACASQVHGLDVRGGDTGGSGQCPAIGPPKSMQGAEKGACPAPKPATSNRMMSTQPPQRWRPSVGAAEHASCAVHSPM